MSRYNRQSPSSRGEALSKSQQQSRRSLNADLSAQQSPNKISFLRQETEPCLAVRSNENICFSVVAFRHFQFLIANRYGRPTFFCASEREMISCCNTLRLVSLKGQRQPIQK